MQHLKKEPLFQILGHAVKADAPDMFKPCASQRLYVHEHPDFGDISEVISDIKACCLLPFFNPALLIVLCLFISLPV